MKSLYQAITGNQRIPSNQEEEARLREAVQALPIDQKKVLELYFTRDLSLKEIAAQMKCSVTLVHNKFHRALFKLKNEINSEIFKKAYSILYPETGKPTTITFSNVFEYDQESNQNIV